MRYLGIDWGMKALGLALSEGTLSTPLRAVTVRSLTEALEKVKELVEQYCVEQIIIGLPEGEMGKKVTEAASRLQKMGFRVKLTDETLSTQEAKKMMIEIGMGQKRRRDDNAQSAALILQRFLDQNEKK